MPITPYVQTKGQIAIDRFYLHHPEYEQHPVAVFFRELMDEIGTYDQGYEDAMEEKGSHSEGYEEGYTKGLQYGREYQYAAALRILDQCQTVEEARSVLRAEKP